MLLIVNNQTNSTRTSTIKNTDANISTPTDTNSAGTVTTSLSFPDGGTITATFPTTSYEDYPSTYAFCGTLPTVISGTSTCLTIHSELCSTPGYSSSGFNSNNGVFTFPSHPPLVAGIQTDIDLSLDPKGWTYMAVTGQTFDDQALLQPPFPDLGVWSCSTPISSVLPILSVVPIPAPLPPSSSPAPQNSIALQAASYVTVTSTSYEPRLPVGIPGQVAHTPALNLAPLPSSQPATAPDNPSTSTQSASVSPSPGVQPASTTQPAQSKQPVPNNSLSLTNTVSNKLPYLGQGPALNNQPAPAQTTSTSPLPGNQPISGIQPSSNDQPVPSQPAHDPTSPQSTTIVPIAVASTNAQGSVAVSTTLAAAIAVLQTSNNNQGKTSVFTTFSPLTADAPVTLIPQAVTSTNAQGSVILATSNVVPVPIGITSTNPQGKAIVTTSTEPSPVALNPTASPIAFIPTTITATNAQGITTVITGTAAILPLVASSTNSQGQIVLSSSLLTAAATAATNIVVSFTNAQGSITSSTTQVSAVISTTTNAQGSQILTTVPIRAITTAFTTPPRITIGSQTIIPNSLSHYLIGLQTLTPGGAITVSGTPISLAPSATALIIGTSTQQLVIGATSLLTFTTGTPTVSSNTVSQYITSTQILTPGGLITLSGMPISLAPSATALIIGSNTIPLGSPTTLPPPLTIGSQVFTANSATQYVIGSQTLIPGGVITISGTRVSLAPGDTAAVVGKSTEELGALITAGLGSGPGKGGARGSGMPVLAVWLEGILILLGVGMVVGL